MTRLSDKTIINKTLPGGSSLPSDFNKSQIDATLRDKGQNVLREQSLLCPCKASVSSSALSDCQNCGGSGYVFVNPTKTKMLVSGIMADNKFKDAALQGWGMVDTGTVKLTAYDSDKFSYMDRVTLLDATSEHEQLLYPSLSDDETEVFVYTQYNVLSVVALFAFVDSVTPLRKLAQDTDYSFVDNILTLVDPTLAGAAITLRYRHRPVFHVIDVLRDSMTSTEGQYGSQKELILPVHALARRAHLIKDVENLTGNRLLDNSWAVTCAPVELSAFERQLRYTSAQDIFNDLTDAQKIALAALLGTDDILLEAGDRLLLEN